MWNRKWTCYQKLSQGNFKNPFRNFSSCIQTPQERLVWSLFFMEWLLTMQVAYQFGRLSLKSYFKKVYWKWSFLLKLLQQESICLQGMNESILIHNSFFTNLEVQLLHPSFDDMLLWESMSAQCKSFNFDFASLQFQDLWIINQFYKLNLYECYLAAIMCRDNPLKWIWRDKLSCSTVQQLILTNWCQEFYDMLVDIWCLFNFDNPEQT